MTHTVQCMCCKAGRLEVSNNVVTAVISPHGKNLTELKKIVPFPCPQVGDEVRYGNVYGHYGAHKA